MTITLKVNGRAHTLDVEANEILLNVLRDRLQLTGAKYGCGIGECGACTVLMGGRTALACQTLAVSAQDQEILTIEGLQQNGHLHALQQAFLDEGAVQCGFCTPGMILSAIELIDTHPDPTTDQIKEAIRGNLCRCTGYTSIIRAVKTGAKKMREGSRP